MRSRGLARKAATAGTKGKAKGIEEDGSKARAQVGYKGQPIAKMRVADLRDALRALGCDQDGKRPELLDRLANPLLKDSTGGNSGSVPADETSERGARYQKRRTLKTFTPLLKGHDTKECPITIASDDEADADGRSEAGVSLAAGPKPGMTRAELLEAVKSLGLKPRGARKMDLEACWHEAVKSRAKEKSSEGDEGQDVRQGKGGGDWGGEKEDKEAQPSVAGVPVMTMTVAILRKHVRNMGLKPSGHLKADLQRCLYDHLLEAQQAKPADAPFVEIREGRAEPVETIALSPNCVLFRGIPVADMEPDTMHDIMKDLDVPVSRKSIKEVTHDLVEALVLRRAEALETRPTKQRWRGRLVYKMRKMEVTNALHHFGADESGKVEAMRSRFRQLLRDWAARDVVITESGGGMGGETVAVNKENDSANPDSPALNRRKTNMIASNESRNDFDADGTEADAGVSDATTVTEDGNDRGRLPLRHRLVTRAARNDPSTRGESSRGEERLSNKSTRRRARGGTQPKDEGLQQELQGSESPKSRDEGDGEDVEIKREVKDKEDAGDGGDGKASSGAGDVLGDGDSDGGVLGGGGNMRPGDGDGDGNVSGGGRGGCGDGDGDENRDAGAGGSGSEGDNEEEGTNSAWGVEDQVEDDDDAEEEENDKDGEGKEKEKQDEKRNGNIEGEVEGKFELDQATDGKPSHLPSSEVVAISDGSPVVVDSARCPELRDTDKGESGRAAMDVDDTDGVNVDARSVSQGDRATVEVAMQPTDGSQWPDCPASEEELEGETVEEVETEGEACEGGTEKFDDESQHCDDGDIEEAPAHEDKDKVEIEAGEEAGPTQTPQVLGMVRSEGEGEKEGREEHLALAGAPGSACTGSETVELDQATDGKSSHLPSSEVIAVSDGSRVIVDSARCPELRDTDKGESGRAAMDMDDTDGVNVDARSVSQGDRAPLEVATQPTDGSQWPDCPASEEELEGDTVEEVETEGEACEGGTEKFDDESQHFDDGDIEEAPAYEDKDKVEFEAGEEAGPTQTPQVLGMVRSEGEGEKEGREGHLALAGAPGSACTGSETVELDQATDGKPSHLPSAEVIAVSDGSPVVVDSARCPELWDIDKGESGRAAMDVDDTDGINVDARSVSQGDRAPVEVATQPTDGSQWPDCPASGEELEGETVEEVEKGGEACEGGTEKFDDESQHFDDGDIEEAPAHEDKDKVEIEAGEEAGPTQTPQVLGMVRSEGEGEKEGREEHLALADAPGSACTGSETVELDQATDGKPSHLPSSEVILVSDGSSVVADSARCPELRDIDKGESGRAAMDVDDTDGVNVDARSVSQGDRATVEVATQPTDGSQWPDCPASEEELEGETVEEVETEGEACEGGTEKFDDESQHFDDGDIEEAPAHEDKDKVEFEAGEEAGPTQTPQVLGMVRSEGEGEKEGREGHLALAGAPGSACTGSETDELDQATDGKPSHLPSSEVIAVSDGSPVVVDSARCPELRDIDKGESGRAAMDVDDTDGVNVDARSVSQGDRAPVEVATQPTDGSQWPDCPASEEELGGDTVEEVDTEGEYCEGGTENFGDESQHFDDEEIVESHVVDGQRQEVETEGMEGTSGAECVWADGDEDEDGNERALKGHVDEEEAESWEDEEGGNDEGASEYEDEEGEGIHEGEGEEEGECMAMAMAMTGDTEEAAIDLAESDEEADNSAPINDDEAIKNSSSDDREAGSIEDGEASVPSDVDSPATIAAVDNDASASAEPVQRVEACVENLEGAVGDDTCADDMDEEDSDEFFEAREALEDSQDRTEASFSGTVDDAPAVEATVDDVTDDCKVGGGAAAEDPREAASSSNGDPAVDARNTNAHNVSPSTRTWFEARDRHPQTVTQPPHSLVPGDDHDHDHDCTKNAVKTKPRDNKAEFRAVFGELGVDDKTAALDFLANPTVRPMDPSLPMLTAEEERRLASATCSGSDWDDKLILALNPFLEQARHLLGRRDVSNCYAGRASDSRWPSGHDTVPAMRSRGLLPTVVSRPTRPDASGGEVAGSVFSTPTRHQAETDQASLFDEKFGRGRLARPPVPGVASNASPFSSATRVPSCSMGPNGSIAPSQAVTPGIEREPAFSPRRRVSSGIGGRPARTLQAKSPSVLRYRLKNLASRRRSRSSLCPSFGPAHEGLGSKPGAGDSGRVAKSDLVQNEMRQQGQQPSTNNSSVHFPGSAAMENSRKRYQASMSESEGAGTMTSRRRIMDGSEEMALRALRVAAVSKATTEVGNILLSVVSEGGGGGDAIDLRRQAREEAAVRDHRASHQPEAGQNEHLNTQNVELEFAFSITDTSARRRPHMFSFANIVPAKRSRPAGGSDHQSLVPAGVFEFPAPGRRVRQRVRIDTSASAMSSTVAPSMTPLEVEGSSETPKPGAGGGGAAVAAGSGELGATSSTVGGALFSRGALSTTTTTKFSFGAQPARDTEPGDSASSAALGHSISSSAASTFAFGSQQYSASDGSNAASAALRLNNAAPLKFGVQGGGIATGRITSKADVQNTRATTAPAASTPTNGFDMSKFVKPGEWKCEACCVRNPPSAAKCLSCETPKSGGASAWSTGKSAIGGRAGNPSEPAPGAFLFSAPSASGLNQNPGAPLFQSPGPATGGFIFGAGGRSVGNSAGFGGPSARSNFGRPPVPRPSRNPSGLFGATSSFAEKPVGTGKNSIQSGFGAASWSAPGGGSNNPPVAPQPQGFMFGSGLPPARANSPPLNPAVAPQPPGFVFGSGPSPAGANSPPPSTKNNSVRRPSNF